MGITRIAYIQWSSGIISIMSITEIELTATILVYTFCNKITKNIKYNKYRKYEKCI